MTVNHLCGAVIAVCAGAAALACAFHSPELAGLSLLAIVWVAMLGSTSQELGRARYRVPDPKGLGRRGPAEVGELAVVLTTGADRRTRAAATGALIRLLPRVDAPTYRAIPPEEKADLRQLLPSTDNVELALALLGAFERLSDVDALPEARLVAAGHAQTTVDRRVVAAARSCAGALAECARRKREAETLLRPSDHVASGTLVRPAPEAEMLVRPAAPPSTSDGHLRRPSDESTAP